MFRINAWKTTFWMAAVAVLLFSASDASAGVVFSDDFESNSVGDNPAGWALNEANLTTNGAADGDMQVVTGTPTTGTGTKVFEIKDPTGPAAASYSAFRNHTDTTLAGSATFSFKIKLGASADFRITADNDNGDTYLRVRPQSTSGSSAGFAIFDGSFNSLQNIVVGDWYEIVKTFTFGSDTWDISIDNLEDAAAPIVTTGLEYFNGTTAGPTKMKAYTIVGLSTAAIDAQFDDFVVSDFAVPEPSTLAMASLVVMLGGTARMRRRIG